MTRTVGTGSDGHLRDSGTMAFALYCWASFPGPPCGGEAVAVHVHPENILSRARVSDYFCRIASMLCTYYAGRVSHTVLFLFLF